MAKKNKKSSKVSIEELRGLLKINQNDLDTEISQQPVIYDQVSQASAITRSLLDQVKSNIDNIEADVSLEIRVTADREEEKLTEGAIKALIHTDKERRKAVAQMLTLKFQADEWDKLENSFRARGYMLRELASLFIAGYYQESTSQGTKRRYREGRAEKISEKMAEKRRNRRTREE